MHMFNRTLGPNIGYIPGKCPFGVGIHVLWWVAPLIGGCFPYLAVRKPPYISAHQSMCFVVALFGALGNTWRLACLGASVQNPCCDVVRDATPEVDIDARPQTLASPPRKTT